MSVIDPLDKVALGQVVNMDQFTEVGGEELGPKWCEVQVKVAIKWEERLIRPYGVFKNMGDATGATIAWPLSLVLN